MLIINTPPGRICGVYFLFLRQHLTYIGRSIHVIRRIGQHTDTGNIFDEVRILEAVESHISGLETYYLLALTPPRNTTTKHHAFPKLHLLAEEYGLFCLPEGYVVGEPPPAEEK